MVLGNVLWDFFVTLVILSLSDISHSYHVNCRLMPIILKFLFAILHCLRFIQVYPVNWLTCPLVYFITILDSINLKPNSYLFYISGSFHCFLRAALLVIAPNSNRPAPATGEWINNVYSYIKGVLNNKKNKLLIPIVIWMNPKIIMLNKRSQTKTIRM